MPGPHGYEEPPVWQFFLPARVAAVSAPLEPASPRPAPHKPKTEALLPQNRFSRGPERRDVLHSVDCSTSPSGSARPNHKPSMSPSCHLVKVSAWPQ